MTGTVALTRFDAEEIRGFTGEERIAKRPDIAVEVVERIRAETEKEFPFHMTVYDVECFLRALGRCGFTLDAKGLHSAETSLKCGDGKDQEKAQEETP